VSVGSCCDSVVRNLFAAVVLAMCCCAVDCASLLIVRRPHSQRPHLQFAKTYSFTYQSSQGDWSKGDTKRADAF